MKRRRVWHSRIGNCDGYFYSSDGIPFFVIGPQCNTHIGPYFIGFLITSTTLILIFFLASYHLMSNTMKTAVWSILITYLVSLVYSGVINPGLEIQLWIKQEDILKCFSDRKFCRVCEVIREDQCLHCIDCDVCVNKRKVHSCILGKCVGAKTFISYYTSIISLITIIACILITILWTK
jgi:DHHC palmitoyltransferase